MRKTTADSQPLSLALALGSLLLAQVSHGETIQYSLWSHSSPTSPPEFVIAVQQVPAWSGAIEFVYTTSLTPPIEWKPIRPSSSKPSQLGIITYTFPSDESSSRYFRIRTLATAPQINEVVSNNDSTLADEDGDFSDWIEIYNPTDETFALNGWGLSDSLEQPLKWRFPDIELPPRDFTVVFASGKSRASLEGPLHTNFRISAEGEPVILTQPEGKIEDQVSLGLMPPDHSLARHGVGSAREWWIVSPENASPGVPNPRSDRTPYIRQPDFNIRPGVHSAPIELVIRSESPSDTIVYTTDGSKPTIESSFYLGPIQIKNSTVVRAMAFRGSHPTNFSFSRITTGTYLINVAHDLPIVTLTTEPGHMEIRNGFLYGFGRDMYQNGEITASFPYRASNAWKDREVEASLEFFSDRGAQEHQQDIGLKIFGGWGSRGYPQKSFALFARSRYGAGKIRYRVFPELEIDDFESLVLRNSGNDNQSTHQIPPRNEITAFGESRSNGSYFVNGNYTLFRDALMQRLAQGLAVDTQAYRPAVLYLNGEYWGIYNIREKLNEHYVESHHGVDSETVDLIEGYGQANAGTARFYREAWNFLNRNLQRFAENYEVTESKYFQINSFMDYHLSVIYFQNFDIGNIKAWRSRDGGRFRWMLYDQDYGFNLWPPEVYLPAMADDFSDYDNMFRFYTNGTGTNTGWPNQGGRTLFLRRLLSNLSFREAFITRCLDLLNSNFAPQRVSQAIASMAAVIRSEIPRHLERWSWPALHARRHGSPFDIEDQPFSLEQWESHVEGLVDFAQSRPDKLRSDLIEHFRLEPKWHTLKAEVTPPNSGSIRINTLPPQSVPWTGIYHRDIPTQLVAVPAPGYRFVSWTGGVQDAATEATTLSDQTDDVTSISAKFIPIE